MLLTAHHQQKQQQTGSWSMKWIKFFLFMTNVMFVVSSVVAIAKRLGNRNDAPFLSSS